MAFCEHDRGPEPSPRPNAALFVKRIVASTFGVELEDIDAPTRSKARIAFARQTAMYLCNVACGMSLTEVAAVFSRDRTTVSHACHLIEDRRDDDHFDQLLEDLEGDIAAAYGPAPRMRIGFEAKSAAPSLKLERRAVLGAFQ